VEEEEVVGSLEMEVEAVVVMLGNLEEDKLRDSRKVHQYISIPGIVISSNIDLLCYSILRSTSHLI
jgi:methyl coenzyme M reductase subunit C